MMGLAYFLLPRAFRPILVFLVSGINGQHTQCYVRCMNFHEKIPLQFRTLHFAVLSLVVLVSGWIMKAQLSDHYGVGIDTMNWLFPVGLRLLVSIACLLICMVVALVFWRQPNPPPFSVLHRPFSRPLPLRDQILHWIPSASSWSWVPRLEDIVLGRRKPVNVYADVIALQDSSVEGLHSSLALGRPSFSDTNGLQVWFLGGRELRSLRGTLKSTPGADFLSHPRISTADGCECSMFVGESHCPEWVHQ